MKQIDERFSNEIPRTLDGSMPELKEYLKPGSTVLDVGCGPGTITVGVAEAVKPGKVVGIDVDEERIEQAREEARNRDAGNVAFQVADICESDLPDDTFDVVYSHTVLHYHIDPVKSLTEQKRVAKKDGWVIASGVRDWGFSPRYPLCPAWEEVWAAYSRCREAQVERYKSENRVPELYFDLYAGRRCVEWFSKAGFDDLKFDVKVFGVEYPGRDGFEPGHLDFLRYDEEPLEKYFKDILEEGFIEKSTLKQAQEEAKAWYGNPHAFHSWVFVWAAGRA
jgi:ubiquinone/menaquinone biosynthesis C-methylase UbiE